jgi:hypothetical protein
LFEIPFDCTKGLLQKSLKKGKYERTAKPYVTQHTTKSRNNVRAKGRFVSTLLQHDFLNN